MDEIRKMSNKQKFFFHISYPGRELETLDIVVQSEKRFKFFPCDY